MKILVCGGRHYDDAKQLNRILTKYVGPDDEIIHGAAAGADLLAEAWAKRYEIIYHGYPAQWNRTQSRGAGHARNWRMLYAQNPDLVIAFPGGRGTAGMIQIARRQRIRVITIKRVLNGATALGKGRT